MDGSLIDSFRLETPPMRRCGYNNIQMLCSHLLAARPVRAHSLLALLPQPAKLMHCMLWHPPLAMHMCCLLLSSS